jgi:PEP-CTERM motif
MHAQQYKRLGICGGVAAMLSFAGQVRADFVFGDFESGLDPFLQLREDNSPSNLNTFNGSVSINATSGSKAGSFSIDTGFQQYLRYDNPDRTSPTSLFQQFANYSSLAVDINVPAGDQSSAFFVHEFVINASDGFGFAQSGNVIPTAGPPDDLKGRGTVTLKWNYRTGIANFDADYAALAADSSGFFQVELVSNYGNGWDGNPITIDNWRLTDPVPEPASLGLLGTSALAVLSRRRRSA